MKKGYDEITTVEGVESPVAQDAGNEGPAFANRERKEALRRATNHTFGAILSSSLIPLSDNYFHTGCLSLLRNMPAPKKSLNDNLRKAKAGKNDEFYTQLTDIERELRHYKDHFRDKTVFCNCDDPRISNFFHYFSYQFETLGLRKLITTCYKNQDMNLFSTGEKEQAVWLEYKGDRNGDRVPNPEEIGINPLQGDGDFRSPESIALLQQADIVVTNPPFSLFREYVAQLIEQEKKFIIVGHQNAITYKEIFKLIKEDKLWLGVDNGGTKWFQVNPDYDITTESRKKVENGKKFFSMGSVVWFTNLDIAKRHEDLILFKTYNPTDYPKYDNYDAINVDKTKDIPMDYAGPMGVPVTFMDKYNPDQFEILGNLGSYAPDGYSLASKIFVNGQKIFKRILIRNKRL